MAINLFSPSPLHALRSVAAPLSACRWNSTSSVPRRTSRTHQAPRAIGGRGLPVRSSKVDRQRFHKQQKVDSESRILERYQTRNWMAGDIYAPHDLSASEMKKWTKRQSPPTDAFDTLNMNPLDQYKNFSIMSEYMTPMGRIKHRNQTGLRPVNQRKLAKAIRRSIAVGLMPSVHKHPAILAEEARIKTDRSSGS